MSSHQKSHSTLISLVLTGRGDIVSADCNGKKMSTVRESGGDRSDNQPPSPDEGRDRWEMSVTLGEGDDDFQVSWSSNSSRSMNFQIRRFPAEESQGPQDTDRDRWELSFDIGPAQLSGAKQESLPHALPASRNGSVPSDHAEGVLLGSP